jgi:hypothetical protein
MKRFILYNKDMPISDQIKYAESIENSITLIPTLNIIKEGKELIVFPEINSVCRFIDKYYSDIDLMDRLSIWLTKNKKKFPLIHIEFISEYYFEKRKQ